jgi:hypothetical protein
VCSLAATNNNNLHSRSSHELPSQHNKAKSNTDRQNVSEHIGADHICVDETESDTNQPHKKSKDQKRVVGFRKDSEDRSTSLVGSEQASVTTQGEHRCESDGQESDMDVSEVPENLSMKPDRSSS